MGLSIPLLLVWLLVFRRKLPSGLWREAPLTQMERSRSLCRNPQLAAQLRVICLVLLTEERSRATRQRPKTWSARLSWWITPLLKGSATTDIRPPRTPSWAMWLAGLEGGERLV